MTIPSTIEKKVQELETRADELRAHRQTLDALRLRDIAREFRRAWELDDEELLTLEQAVIYSRGYSEAYLRRTLTNYGTSRKPRYRKGDTPRHPVHRTAA